MPSRFPPLPKPTPLQRAALIEYEWGPQHFEILCIACSIRLVPWPDTGEEVTWLHCSAIQTMNVKTDESANMMNVLIPAHYVTGLKPGPTFHLNRSGTTTDIGIFPPIHPAPPNRLSLKEIDTGLAALLTVELN